MPNENYLTDDDKRIVQNTINEVADNPAGRVLPGTRRNRNNSGAFDFSGYDFETTQDDTTVTIGRGNIVGGLITQETIESTVEIDVGVDGTHYVYIEINWAGAWEYAFGANINARPDQQPGPGMTTPVYRKVLAIVEVADGVISTFAPNHIGEIDIPRVT